MAVVLAFSGCVPGEGVDDGRVSVRDSAGVTIVENHGSPEDISSWSLSDSPVLELGVVDGPEEYQFHGITDLALVSDSVLAVLNGGSGEVRFYDRAGSHLRTVGGSGEGPGEFQAPISLWRFGIDSLLVWDGRLQRFSLISPEGRVHGVAGLRPAYPNRPRIRGVLGPGEVLMIYRVFDPPEDGFEEQVLHLLRVDVAGGSVDTVGTFPWIELGPVSGTVGGPLFDARTFAALSAGRIVVAMGERAELRMFDPEGELRQIARWPAGDRRVSQDDVETYRENLFSEVDDSATERLLARRLSARPVAEEFPTLENLLADREGNLWLKEYRRPGAGDSSAWLVFDPDGRLQARIQLPERLQVEEIGSDYLLGVWKDAADVEYVRWIEIRKSQAPRR
jgi:hypothetical protein